MTIALGVLTSESVVIAADTEIGVEYLKTGQGKVSYSRMTSVDPRQRAALAVGGCGSSEYLSHVRKELIGQIDISKPVPSAEDLAAYSSNYIEEFYAKHILPFAVFGDKCPDLQVVIGYYMSGQGFLWSTEHNLLMPQSQFVTLGAGSIYARILLNQVYMHMWPLSSRRAILLAAYIIYHVKDCIPYCGKETDIVCLDMLGNRGVSRDQVREMETVFKECSALGAGMLSHVFADYVDDKASLIPKDVRRLSEVLEELLPLVPVQAATISPG